MYRQVVVLLMMLAAWVQQACAQTAWVPYKNAAYGIECQFPENPTASDGVDGGDGLQLLVEKKDRAYSIMIVRYADGKSPFGDLHATDALEKVKDILIAAGTQSKADKHISTQSASWLGRTIYQLAFDTEGETASDRMRAELWFFVQNNTIYLIGFGYPMGQARPSDIQRFLDSIAIAK